MNSLTIWRKYSKKEKAAFLLLILFFAVFSSRTYIRSGCFSSPCSRFDSSNNVSGLESDYFGHFTSRPLLAPTTVLVPLSIKWAGFEQKNVIGTSLVLILKSPSIFSALLPFVGLELEFDDINETFTQREEFAPGVFRELSPIERERMLQGYLITKGITLLSIPFWFFYASVIIRFWRRNAKSRALICVLMLWVALSSLWSDSWTASIGSTVYTWSFLFGQ